jgi:coenzyme PQQ synthesis protein D (PqqD)
MTEPEGIGNDTAIRRGASVVFQDLDGEAVLVHLQRGTCFTLDPIGTRIWQLIGDGALIAEIIDALRLEFDVAADVLAADVRALVAELLSRELCVAGVSNRQ